MARKKKKPRPTKPRVPAAPPAFDVGARVRVKAGICDPDYADMPLGGWAGTIGEVNTLKDGHLYLVEWNEYTLDHAHPVYVVRCDRDGLDEASAWLSEADLELDTGGVVRMEQPQTLTPPPLDPSVPDDRIRALFQLTSDEPLPPVTDANVRRFYDHLLANVQLPLTATNAERELTAPPDKQGLILIEFLPPIPGEAADGLFCTVTCGDERFEMPLGHLEPQRDDRSARLVMDYTYWMWTQDESGPVFVEQGGEDDVELISPMRYLFNTVSRCGLYSAAAGAAVGAVTATMENVPFAMCIGAAVLAVIGYLLGTNYGSYFAKISRNKAGTIFGGIFGILAGALLGVVAGALVIAYFGTIVGSIAGTIVGFGLKRISLRLPGKFKCGVAGALIGAGVEAWYTDVNATLNGVLWGTISGATAGLLLAGAFFGILMLMTIKPEQQG